jgi:hypothetical protein
MRRIFRLTFVICFVISYHSLQAQNYKATKIISIDVNSIINPKNCNNQLTSINLLTTRQRCFEAVKSQILAEPNIKFIVVYLFDLPDSNAHFYREFAAQDKAFINDSVSDFRNMEVMNILDNDSRVHNLLLKLDAWGFNLSSMPKVDVTFYFGCGINQSETIQVDYINRLLVLSGLIDKSTLKTKNDVKITLNLNQGNNQNVSKNETYNYEIKTF